MPVICTRILDSRHINIKHLLGLVEPALKVHAQERYPLKEDVNGFTVGDEVIVTVVGSIPAGNRALSAASIGITGKTPANFTALVGSVV